jgi:predicted nucleic acid-binding protein
MNLALVGVLDLLRQQFGEVVIPTAVVDELKLIQITLAQARTCCNDGWLVETG